MAFTLPALPYDKNELAPTISSETIDFHYGKHHQAYVTKLNELVAGTSLESKTLEEIICSKDLPQDKKIIIFNNAAQIWNHTFYWNCLSPKGGGQPKGALLASIEKQFGSFDTFKEQFSAKAVTLFGSGWAWLIKNKDGTLSITQTTNANTPLTEEGQTALLTCDVWEHAYYIDYRNARPKYVESFWKLVNWEFVEKNLN